MRIHILVFLLFIQSFVACQPDHEKELLPTTNIVFQSGDNGQTWQDVSAGLPKEVEFGSAFVSDGEVFLGYKNGLYHSNVGSVAPIWEQEIFLGEKIADIFPNQAGPYASDYKGGFFQNITGTGIWQARYNSLKDNSIRTILETTDGNIFIGCDNGIFKSADAGKTWNQVFAAQGIYNLVAAGDVLIAGGRKGLLRSTDGGAHWDLVLTEDGGIIKTGIIGDRLFAITDGGTPWNNRLNNRARVSADGGKTWQRIDGTLPPAKMICDMEQIGKYLFCSQDAGIFRSSDLGNTWELVRPSVNGKLFSLAAIGKVIVAMPVVGRPGC